MTEDLFSIAGQRALDLSDLLVGGVSQPAACVPFPQQGQSELQQRQRARLLSHVFQNAIDQAGLEGCALQFGRFLNGRPQLPGRHRPQQQRARLQRVGQRAVGQRLAHEVGPQGEQQRASGR